MKTPRELAIKYALQTHLGGWEVEASEDAFLAGYEAAKDHYFQMIQDLQNTVVELKQELKKTK